MCPISLDMDNRNGVCDDGIYHQLGFLSLCQRQFIGGHVYGRYAHSHCFGLLHR